MPCFVSADESAWNRVQGWDQQEDFASFGRLITKDGSALTGDYRGEHYRIVAKFRREFSEGERFVRSMKALACILSSVGLAAGLDSVRRLMCETHDVVRLAEPLGVTSGASSDLSVEEELALGLDIPSKDIDWVNNNFRNFFERVPIAGVTYFRSQHSHAIFTTDRVPGVVFKLQQYAQTRYRKSVKAKEICIKYHLNQLVVPHIRLIQPKFGPCFIVEEQLDFNSTNSGQQEAHLLHAHLLSEPLRQMCHLIEQMRLSDVELRNIPILRDTTDPLGLRQFALTDLEETHGGHIGLLGTAGGYWGVRTGLVHIVATRHIAMIEKFAKRHWHWPDSTYRERKEKRKQALARLDAIKQYHQQVPLENFNIQLEPLGIDPKLTATIPLRRGDPANPQKWIEYEQEIKIENLARAIQDDFNNQLAQKSPDESQVGKRKLYLSAPRGYRVYNRPEIEGDDGQTIGWIDHLLNRMVRERKLFSWESDADGFTIQA